MNNKLTNICMALIAATMLFSCSSEKLKVESIVNPKNFDTIINNKQVKVYFLTNSKGVEMAVTNYGGRIISLLVPDKEGKATDVVLGCDRISDYFNPNTIYYGAFIGRYGNRIAKGQFMIDSDTFSIPKNNNGQSLHGGPNGFHNQVMDATQPSKNSLELTRISVDGEEGYPGNLNVKLVYMLTDSNELKITYEATTDKATVVNLTNHSYFNLNGAGNGTINDLLLNIFADKFSAVDSVLIPTSNTSVEGTPFDFRTPTAIGARVNEENAQLKAGKGYDHNFVINRADTVKGISLDATLYSPKTGIFMEILSDQPGLQFYGGNFMNNDPGKGGKTYQFREGLCVETQKFPNSPNEPTFPSTLLKPGEVYSHTSIYKFSVK